MQDYDRHDDVFRPAIAQSKNLEHDGDRFRLFLRFFMKKVITVVVNTESTAEFTQRWRRPRSSAPSAARASRKSKTPGHRRSARSPSGATAATCGG